MKSHKNFSVFALMMVAAFMSSCEKMVLSESTKVENSGKSKVVLRVSQFEQIPLDKMTRAEVGSVCGRLNYAIYDNSGTRVELVTQKSEDTDFGVASFALEKGDYRLVVVGHNAQNNPSFRANEKVTISGKNLTDTFWGGDELRVDNEDVNMNLFLKRIVAMVRIIPEDAIPEGSDSLCIGYRGSRGSFDGRTGYGNTTAQQNVSFKMSKSDSQYDFYMIPRAERDTINLMVETYSPSGILAKKEIAKVPVHRNCATICRGNLFDNAVDTNNSTITITVDDTWGDTIQHPF